MIPSPVCGGIGCAGEFNTLHVPLLSDRSGARSGTGLSKKTVAAQNKRRMTQNIVTYSTQSIQFAQTSHLEPLTGPRESSLPLEACEMACLLGGKKVIIQS